jgi:hypothetical protein
MNFRNFWRVFGGLLMLVGLSLISSPFWLKSIYYQDFVCVFGGVFVTLVGFMLAGLDGMFLQFQRRRTARRLSRTWSRMLGSRVEVGPDYASLRWLGTRNGRRLAIAWTLDVAATQVSIPIEGIAPGTLRLMPNLARIDRLLGGRAIPTGHAEFDRQFLGRSDPPTLIPDLFSGDRRDPVATALMTLPGGPPSLVFLSLTDLRIRIPRVADRIEMIESLFEAAERVAGAVHEMVRETGYAVLALGTGTTGRCPICVSPLENEVVLCMKCRTPHHQGCWHYTGECATFACGGRRWVRT